VLTRLDPLCGTILYIYMLYIYTSSTAWEYVVELMAPIFLYIPWIFVGSYVWNLWIFWLIFMGICIAEWQDDQWSKQMRP
jgi:hypothetical protein